MNYLNMTAPCGLSCFNCPLYKANTDEKLKLKVSKSLNVPIEKVTCKGCRNENGIIPYLNMNEPCNVYKCITKKKINFCNECSDFPCDNLQPYSDFASTKPHNLKVYNLCLIKKLGLTKWAIEKADQVLKSYYKDKWKI